MILHLKKHKELIILCSISLIIRLIIMPYAQSIDSDATCRVFDARNLLDNFRIIMSGHWAPIHRYLYAFILIIIPDNVYGPKVLSIIFSVISCIPLYLFTKNEFNKQGAFFVTLIYSFCPVVFNNSFMAMAEVSFAFFILLSLYFLSKGIRTNQKIKYAIFSGLSITIAGGIRYESWEIMTLFFGILILFKQWKMIIPYTLIAILFPVYWMIGNQIENNDFLYSFHYGTNWINNIAHYNDNLTKYELLKRLVFFPISWFLMLTPFISAILLFILFYKIITNKIQKNHLIWLILFVVMLITYSYSAYKGTLYTQHRFSITLVLFSVPFFALFFENEKYLKIKKIVTYIIIISMIPLSFFWNKIPFNDLFKNSFSLSYILHHTIRNDEAIPLINDDATEAISKSINYYLSEKKGLIIDLGCENAYYIALNTKMYKNIYFIDNNSQKDDVINFISKFPEGLILIKAFSSFDNKCHSIGALMEIENIILSFYLEKILDISNTKLFRFKIKSKEWTQEYKSKNNTIEGITKTIKNVEYYKNSMRKGDWYLDEKEKAKKNNVPIEDILTIDAQWMIEQDSINTKKDSTTFKK